MGLAKRIIPCLDVDCGRVVKGVNFVDLIDAGALVTINTDDPAMFDISLVGEFSNLEQRVGLDDAALERLSLGSVEGSWADDETRADLKGRIEDCEMRRTSVTWSPSGRVRKSVTLRRSSSNPPRCRSPCSRRIMPRRLRQAITPLT